MPLTVSGGWRVVRHVGWTAGVLTVLLAYGAHAQSTPSAASRQAWRFQSQASVDLWYHGLAVIGYEGFGLLPLYDREYASTIREAKEARGIGPTPLDTLAGSFLRAFDRDSVFELFHFVPLYVDRRTPEDFLDALEGVARGRDPTDAGTQIVAAIFTRSASRDLLGELVEALRAEWDIFYEAYWQDGASERARHLGAAQALWNQRFGPALHGFMVRRNLVGGVAFASPPVGAEGRVFAGVPGDQRDNRVAVWLPSAPFQPDAVAFALVREMCFPLVSQVVAESGAGRWDRVVAERVSSYGAVRCGSDLLERYAPDLVPAYQHAFMLAADEPENSGADFATVFPVDPNIHQQILAALDASR